MDEPQSPSGVRAGIFTEVAFGFPRSAPGDEVFASFIMRSSSRIYELIVADKRPFNFCLLNVAQLSFAAIANRKSYDRAQFHSVNGAPSVVGSDAVFSGRVRMVVHTGMRNAYEIVIADVMDADRKAIACDPLVNHDEHYRRLDSTWAVPVSDPGNDRLTRQSS